MFLLSVILSLCSIEVLFGVAKIENMHTHIARPIRSLCVFVSLDEVLWDVVFSFIFWMSFYCFVRSSFPTPKRTRNICYANSLTQIGAMACFYRLFDRKYMRRFQFMQRKKTWFGTNICNISWSIPRVFGKCVSLFCLLLLQCIEYDLLWRAAHLWGI